jgi:hypothetical protein
MKAQIVLLALLAVSPLANAKEKMMKPVDAAKTFNELKGTAEVLEKGLGGYMKIAQGDVICYRWPERKIESVLPFRYACTYWVDDAYLPAYPEARSPRAAHGVK